MSRPRLTLARRLAREIDTSWLDERDADAFNERMVAAIVLGMEADVLYERWLREQDEKCQQVSAGFPRPP